MYRGMPRRTFISIHAPVKGATVYRGAAASESEDFNPRTREGCDPIDNVYIRDGLLISIHAPVKGATANS